MFQKSIIFSCLLILCSWIAFAEEGFRQEKKHVHGEAIINLVWVDQKITVDLETPSYNLLGFEHAPDDEKQTQYVQKVIQSIQQNSNWVQIEPSFECSADFVKVNDPFGMAGNKPKKKMSLHLHHDHDSHEKEHHDEHGHDHEEHGHDHEEHGHDHEEHGHDHHEMVHSDFSIQYEFTCKKDKGNKKIDFAGFFQNFPLMESIEARWITKEKQSWKKLTGKSAVLTLE